MIFIYLFTFHYYSKANMSDRDEKREGKREDEKDFNILNALTHQSVSIIPIANVITLAMKGNGLTVDDLRHLYPDIFSNLSQISQWLDSMNDYDQYNHEIMILADCIRNLNDTDPNVFYILSQLTVEETSEITGIPQYPEDEVGYLLDPVQGLANWEAA